MSSAFSQVHKTITVTATAAGVEIAELTSAELYDQEEVMLLFMPGRTGDVELRHVAGDATRRHIIPQQAGGNEPYPDGPWLVGAMPKVLRAEVDTEVTIEIIRVTP